MTAPALTTEFIKTKIEAINSVERRSLRFKDYTRFRIYNGQLEPAIEEAIRKEFKKPETIDGLIHRLVPINVLKQIINKLSGVYIEAPMRTAADKNESDQEFIDSIEKGSGMNIKQKEANRYFKLFKRNLQEPFVDQDGTIRLRNLPRHQYEVFSHNTLRPEVPDVIVKILVDSMDPEIQRYAFYTDKEHVIVDGKGKVDVAKMINMQNTKGINPYGVLPFVYTNEASYSVDPLANDSLLRMSVLIPLLLTDLAFTSKYQTWSIIWVAGYDGDIPASPNSILSLPLTPDGKVPQIGTVKPEFDMQDALRYIESLTSSLLVTNSLSSQGDPNKMNAHNVASGISKAIDEATSTEDRKDQQQFFLEAENTLWMLLHKHMIPVWRKQRVLRPEQNKEFSRSFELSITLREPKVTMTEQEQIKLSKDKLEAGFTTLQRELSALNPDMDPDEIEELENDILEEALKRKRMQITMFEDESLDNGE